MRASWAQSWTTLAVVFWSAGILAIPVSAVVAPPAAAQTPTTTTSTTVVSAGTSTSINVPSWANTMSAVLVSGAGGEGGSAALGHAFPAPGGSGATFTVQANVAPNAPFFVWAGGNATAGSLCGQDQSNPGCGGSSQGFDNAAGGFPDGGQGGSGGNFLSGGGGGGSSGIGTCGSCPSGPSLQGVTPVVVAGGGGGAGNTNDPIQNQGGFGGNATAGNGSSGGNANPLSCYGGTGGTSGPTGTPGRGGGGCAGSIFSPSHSGTDGGSSSVGNNGQTPGAGPTQGGKGGGTGDAAGPAGGGGGGGFMPGGGGGGGDCPSNLCSLSGGGGGSGASYISSGWQVSNAGTSSGPGSVTITFTGTVAPTTTTTFAYSGAAESWQVPPGVSSVVVTASGAQGGAGGPLVGDTGPGLGAQVTATVAVSGGQILTVVVGGQGVAGASGGAGGFGGGAAGGSPDGGGGGGATSLLLQSTALVVAGAGGGGGAGQGPAGGSGGPTGGAGGGSFPGIGGGGGGAAAGGAGGQGANGGASGAPGTAGAGGVGGSGSQFDSGGGGGGGGLYGGGGGGACVNCAPAGSGGGGSSLAPSGATITTGTNAADGSLTISWGGTTQVLQARPDLSIRAGGDGPLVGDGQFPPTRQEVSASVSPNEEARFEIRIANVGRERDRFRVLGADQDGFAARYLDRGHDVTDAVNAGTVVTPLLASGDVHILDLVVRSPAAPGAGRFSVQARASDDSSFDEVVASVSLRSTMPLARTGERTRPLVIAATTVLGTGLVLWLLFVGPADQRHRRRRLTRNPT